MLAVATKLLPIVLVPLLLGRVRLRDAAIGVALLGLLYLPFYDPAAPAFGAVPNVVAYIRFNGPVFLALAAVLTSPRVPPRWRSLAGLATACIARWRLPASDPAAWAWPMAVALVCAPVIYPWYLLYLTPFLWTRATRAAAWPGASAASPPMSSGTCRDMAAGGSCRRASRRSSSRCQSSWLARWPSGQRHGSRLDA